MQDRARRIVSTIGVGLLVLAGSIGGGFLFQATMAPTSAVAQDPGPVMAETPPSFAALADEVQSKVVAIGTKTIGRPPMAMGPGQPGQPGPNMPFGPGIPEDFFGEGLEEFFGDDMGMMMQGDEFTIQTPEGEFRGTKDENGQWWLETPDGEKKKWDGPGSGNLPFFNFGPQGNGAPEQPEAAPQLEYPMSVGSGVLISPEGHVITNSHVVQALKEINPDDIWVVLYDEEAVPARIIGEDEETDVAVLKVDVDYPLPFSSFGDSDNVHIGDWLMAVGHPFGLEHTFTTGILSARGRHLGKTYDQYLQTDAMIHPGNSGGPLYDMNGDIIGINTAIATNSPMRPVGQGIGFAIPSNVASDIVQRLIDEGQIVRGYIGVSLGSGPQEAAARPYDYGALLREVRPGQPAAGAGLQEGDVIISWGTERVERAEDLIRMASQAKPGQQVTIEYVRDGEISEATITVTERPSLEELMAP
ncbi:MAG: PDZ domain-containing protein [Armatimonadia bacterium]|nr:PDZ domain-containing protein [Armatimonadia bacterium]